MHNLIIDVVVVWLFWIYSTHRKANRIAGMCLQQNRKLREFNRQRRSIYIRCALMSVDELKERYAFLTDMPVVEDSAAWMTEFVIISDLLHY